MKADEGRESDPDPHREGQGGALGGVVRVQEPPGEDARSFLRDPHWVFVPAEAPGRGAPKSVNVSWEACRAQQVASRGNSSASRLSHGPSPGGLPLAVMGPEVVEPEVRQGAAGTLLAKEDHTVRARNDRAERDEV